MQTQCPHCDTRFRLTESQVNTADGFVRCSVCKEIFNAIDVAPQHEFQQPLLRQTNTDGSTDDRPEQTVDPDFSTEHENTDSQYTGIDDFDDDVDEDGLDGHIEKDTEIEQVDFNEKSATDDIRKDAFDFFNEESNEPLPHVVPEKFKDSHDPGSSTFLSSLIWSAGILLLAATLLIEYTWFNRDKLNQVPELQAWAENLCQRIDCRNITMRDPDKIELISRNVYSHPNEKNALMVNITMKNLADFAQPYPVMQINFSDVRGGSVAARRFLPSEYLPGEYLADDKELLLLEPDSNMTFTMEIQDPGKQAMTYEFEFL